MGCSGNLGGKHLQSACRIRSSSRGPTGRYNIVLPLLIGVFNGNHRGIQKLELSAGPSGDDAAFKYEWVNGVAELQLPKGALWNCRPYDSSGVKYAVRKSKRLLKGKPKLLAFKRARCRPECSGAHDVIKFCG